jgi:hypothetical protein
MADEQINEVLNNFKKSNEKTSKFSLNLYYAKVINVKDNENHSDKKKKNRVKIRVYPYMEDWKEDHLPWAWPMHPAITGGHDKGGMSASPSKDSYIWVFFEDEANWKRPYYFIDARFPNNSLATKFYDDVKDKLGKLDKVSQPDPTYPDVISFFCDNGLCISYDRNSDSPMYNVYHPKGSYILIDKDGNVGIYSKKNVEVKTNDNVQFYTDGKNTKFTDGNDNKIETNSNGMKVTDKNSQEIKTSSTGIKMTTVGGSYVDIQDSQVKIQDVAGNKATIGSSGIVLETILQSKLDLGFLVKLQGGAQQNVVNILGNFIQDMLSGQTLGPPVTHFMGPGLIANLVKELVRAKLTDAGT